MTVSRIIPLSNFLHDQGHAYRVFLPKGTPQGDGEGTGAGSLLRLFEDGCELGPAHMGHDVIRRDGMGRFSHWGQQIWFATSDNSSPLTNGRRYDALVPGEMYEPGGGKGIGLSAAGLDNVPPFDRFNLAREQYRRIWPHSVLPDFGRSIDMDQDFAAEFRRVSPDADYSHERKYNLDQLFQLTGNVPGDVAECGTFRGASAYFLARRIERMGISRQLYLFDSFEGLSVPADLDGAWWRPGDLAATPSDLRRTLAPISDHSFIHVLPGWIPDRFPEVADRAFCFVHVDVDLFRPTLDCLEFFYPRMSRGGVILFDDYGHQSCPGATLAVDQYMAGRPEPVVNLASGGSFLVKQ
ncbi:MAG TPA: TylF/MycF/NovP-related O-methyltransferase [Magnetospirillum sp.]|nr:TylF/MycF/NovP-related O-methyltransferase [Magnetospirillum sp.]